MSFSIAFPTASGVDTNIIFRDLMILCRHTAGGGIKKPLTATRRRVTRHGFD